MILATAVAAATSVCAQNTTEVPALSDMAGDYLVLNSQEYNGVKNLASMKAFTISPSGSATLTMSGFYMTGCLDFDAEYNEKNGGISITSPAHPFTTWTHTWCIFIHGIRRTMWRLCVR